MSRNQSLFRAVLALIIIFVNATFYGQQSDVRLRNVEKIALAERPTRLSNETTLASTKAIDRVDATTGQVEERTYYPARMRADDLGKRFVSLLPTDYRNATTWRTNPQFNSITITAPRQVLASADQLIPRMDNNSQLRDQNVEVGVAEYETSSFGRSSESPIRNVSGERYYDPQENRYVRVAYQPKNAVFPDSVSNEGLAEMPLNIDSDSSNDPLAFDIVAYYCEQNRIAPIDAHLRKEFASYPEITFSSDPQSGRILVYTTRQRHAAVREFLASMQIHPISDVLRRNDPRIEQGIVHQVEAKNVAAPVSNVPASDSYAPTEKPLDELERFVVQALGDRLQRTTPREQNPDVVPYTERQKVSYRFLKRRFAENEPQRSCDLQFDFYNRRVHLNGDSEICRQLIDLLTLIDRQPTVQNGKARRFISIRYSDPNKLQEVLDVYSGNNPQSYFSAKRNGRFSQTLPTRPIDSSNIFNENSVVRASNNQVGSFQEYAKNESRTSRPSERLTRGVRPVSYQEGLGGDLGGGLSGDLSGGLGGNLDGGFGNMDGGFDPNVPGGRQGVGVVQDFVPIVLPDLDIIIIDNASDVEYERIRKMISDIEELAKRAEYQIEVYHLRYVNSVMLQGILQTLISQSPVVKNKTGNVAAYGIQNPNAMLLIGWGKALETVKDLIEVFDQPIQEGSGTIRVVRLKYQSAAEMATKLTTYFPTPQGATGGFAPRVRLFADVRTNSLVIQAAPNDLTEIQRILAELDVNKTESRLRIQTFPLKHSLATDIRTTLMNTILTASQGTLETSATKFPVLEILSVDSQNRRLIESGIMMDVSITADVEHNQLIVSAPEDCLELIGQLIQVLDVASPRAQIKVIQIKYGDSTQIAETLQNTFASTGGNAASTPTLPNADGETSFIPVRFAIDTRTNTIIVASSPKDFQLIYALILALDQPDSKERRDVVVPLRNVQAFAVGEAIDNYLTRKQQLEVASGALSDYQMLESNVIVIPEEYTNSLLISATPENLEKILDMVEVFDRDPAKVVIQVLIAEVNLNNQEEFGIEAGLQDSVSFDRSMITTTSSGSTGDPGYNIINGSGPGKNMESDTTPTDVAGQILNNFGMGTASSDLNFGGFVLSASSRSVQVTLRALQEKQRLQILSRPQITAMDNSQAFILVGQRVPRVGGAQMTNYGTQTDIQDEPVGLILLVTPRVTADGRVIMEIGAEKSSIGSESEGTPVFSSGDQVIKSAPIDTVQAMTAISAHDGETVMIGGLIRTSKQKISRGVPYLSNIPVLGWLFRYDKDVEMRKELLIVMTPRIIRDSKDLDEVKRIEASKMNWNLGDAMGLQGNMGLFDPMTGKGMVPQETQDRPIIHPDPMTDLDDSFGYSPQNDYNPKEVPPSDSKFDLNKIYGTPSATTPKEPNDSLPAVPSFDQSGPSAARPNPGYPNATIVADDEMPLIPSRQSPASENRLNVVPSQSEYWPDSAIRNRRNAAVPRTSPQRLNENRSFDEQNIDGLQFPLNDGYSRFRPRSVSDDSSIVPVSATLAATPTPESNEILNAVNRNENSNDGYSTNENGRSNERSNPLKITPELLAKNGLANQAIASDSSKTRLVNYEFARPATDDSDASDEKSPSISDETPNVRRADWQNFQATRSETVLSYSPDR